MLSGGDAWTVITQNRIIDADSHLVCLAETPPTIPEEIWNETWSEEYGPEMEPLNSDKYETCSIGRSLEVPDVVKKKQCMIYKLPPELIGLILANLEHRDVANFRLVRRECASHGLPYLFKKGKARLSLCREVGYRMDTITKKDISWRIKDLELCGDMKDQCLEIIQNPEHFHSQEYCHSGHTLHNLRSLELRLQPRPEIPVCIHLAASKLLFCFLLHLLIMHSSPITNLRLVHVGWWGSYKEGTTLMEAISKLERFELVGHLDSPNYYGDVLSYLSSMNELKNLVIDFGMESVNGLWDITYICELTFDHLHSVHLSNLSTSEQKLLRFFEHHPKLQDVHIGTMLLVNGSWTQSIHAMSRLLPDLKNIKFSGLQSFRRGEGVYEEGYICSNSLNAYIKRFTWPIVGLVHRARERPVTVEMLCQERSIRDKKAATGNSWTREICGTCGYLQEFCTRLT